MAFTKVATTQELPAGTARQLTVNGRKVALFNINGSYYAIDDTCPHRGGPLSEGDVEGNEVTCPWHGACFDVTTGAHLSPPAQSDVAAYKVQVVGDEIQVEVP
jgi:nitrite reductase/ring-hydroxylating ferredoxin subunit